MEVVGKPQVLPFKANFKQDFPLHSDAVIKASFCSDPKPRNLKWQWGSLLLTGGKLLNSYMESEGQIITEAILLASFLPRSKQNISLIKSAIASNRGQKRHFIIILNA